MKLVTAVLSLLLFQLPPSPKAAIEGAVYRSTTSTPVEGARVTLTRFAVAGNTAVPLATISDSDGKFAFSNLEPGSYKMSIANAGFARQDYRSTLTVVAGQVMKSIAVRMVPAGNISGHLLDSDRRPVGQLQVQLFRATYNSSGKRAFQLVQSSLTDDLGEYRMFWVTPGRYYLSSRQDPRRRDLGVNFPETFYPGVTDPDAAIAIEIPPESEMTADLILTAQQLYHIRGRVVDTTTTKPPAQARVNLRAGNSLVDSASYNPINGNFVVDGVAPGSYIASAQSQTDSSLLASSLATRPSLAGFAELTVSGADLENVVINLLPSVTVAGRLQVEAPAPSAAPGTNVSVQLSSAGLDANCGSSTPPDVDGRFTIDGISPGARCRVSSVAGMANYYIKDVRFNSGSALYDFFQIDASGERNLDVVINGGSGQIDGNVTDTSQHSVDQAYIALVPEQHREVTSLYRNAKADDKGHFSLRNIPPGDYKLFAFEYLEPYGYFDPDFSKEYGAKGTSIHVTESSRNALDLKAISATGQ